MKRLLVALDFSADTGGIVRIAIALGRALHAEVRLLHVAPPEPDFIGYDAGPPTVRQQAAAEYQEARRELHALERQFASEGMMVDALVIQGDPRQKIPAEAKEFRADLIILGARGRGAVHEWLVGGVTSAVIKKADCPVIVVPPQKE